MKKKSLMVRGDNTLKALRRNAEKTQRQVAAELDVDQRTVSDWENGAIPAFDKAIALALCLNVSLKQLADSLGFCVDNLPDDQPKQNA